MLKEVVFWKRTKRDEALMCVLQYFKFVLHLLKQKLLLINRISLYQSTNNCQITVLLMFLLVNVSPNIYEIWNWQSTLNVRMPDT